MIKNSAPLSMAESLEYLDKDRENLKGFIGKFVKIDSKQAKEMKKEISELNLIKISEKHTSKIIDLMPSDLESINKIFSDVSLNEDESNKIIDIVKKFE